MLWSQNFSRTQFNFVYYVRHWMMRMSTVSYIHWRGVPQGPGLGLRPRPGPLRCIPTVNVGKLFSHAPRMAQITAAARSWLPIVVLSREPCNRRGEMPFSDISHLGGKYRVWIFPLGDSRGSTGKSTLDSDHLFVCRSSRDMGERHLHTLGWASKHLLVVRPERCVHIQECVALSSLYENV